MGTIIKGNYQDNFRCELVHSKSNSTLNTDAPTDNNGKGQNFSPTDLLAAGLGSCMITIIAIRAASKTIEIGQPIFEIEKIMNDSPRAISEIRIKITFTTAISILNRSFLEKEAKNCPVALSLSDKIQQKIEFIYEE